MSRLLYVVNDVGFFLSHRLAIAQAAQREGLQVHLAAGGEITDELRRTGIHFHPLALSRSGMNPLSELSTLWHLVRLFRRIRPDLVHLVTIKPYLYGGIAARLVGVPAVVSAVAGLGMLMGGRGLRGRMLRAGLQPLYRFAFHHPRQHVLFQNPDDRKWMQRWMRLPMERSSLLPGSGVDLAKHVVREEAPGPPIIVFAGRLLRDKGVEELVQAVRILRSRGIEARCWILGVPDPGNPSTVSAEELQAWQSEGWVDWLGHRSDIPECFSQAHIICLPSYYGEGLPKVLAEAAASGRAVVTTDHPGCRDAIKPGITGLLVPPRDPKALADALQRLIENPEQRRAMGRAGRDLAQRTFAIESIVDAHLDLYRELLPQQSEQGEGRWPAS